jgi:hypothetical protein
VRCGLCGSEVFENRMLNTGARRQVTRRRRKCVVGSITADGLHQREVLQMVKLSRRDKQDM